MATSGEKSSTPNVGIMRRSGDRIGSVIRNKMAVSIFVVPGENQERIARRTMATVSTSQRTLIKLKKNPTIACYLTF